MMSYLGFCIMKQVLYGVQMTHGVIHIMIIFLYKVLFYKVYNVDQVIHLNTPRKNIRI